MKGNYLNLYLNNQGTGNVVQKDQYDKKRDIASKILKNFSLVCAGGYLGSLFSDNLYLGMILLSLALGSAGARHYLLERKK